ncbi:MAG: aminotransferase class IV [Bacteroidota bacterium]
MNEFETVFYSEGNSGLWQQNPCLGFPNRALSFGDGLFETMVWEKGTIRYFDLHVERLVNGMKLLGLDISQIDPNSVLELVKGEKPRRIKWIVYRIGGGKYSPETSGINQLVEISAFQASGEVVNEAVFSKKVFLTKTMFSHCKTLNALPYILAAKERIERQVDEIILLDSFGNIAEGGASSIFWRKGEKVFTPSLATGCIAGISRKVIIQRLVDQGVELMEGLFKKSDLLTADQVWISNVTGIRYVQSVEGQDFHSEPMSNLQNLF